MSKQEQLEKEIEAYNELTTQITAAKEDAMRRAGRIGLLQEQIAAEESVNATEEAVGTKKVAAANGDKPVKAKA